MAANVFAKNKVHKHIQANDTYYVDLGNLLNSGETVSSATVASTDTGLTLGTPAVLGGDTTVTDYDGNSLTIEANTGISFTLSSGTVGCWLVTVVMTKSTGGIDAVDCELEIAGEAA